MPRTAKITYHFRELKRDGWFVDYAVEAHQGRTRWTIGRISGVTRRFNPTWQALPIGAPAWTRRRHTRREALDALLAREDFRTVSEKGE